MSPHKVRTESLSNSLHMHFPLLPEVWIHVLQRDSTPRKDSIPSSTLSCCKRATQETHGAE